MTRISLRDQLIRIRMPNWLRTIYLQVSIEVLANHRERFMPVHLMTFFQLISMPKLPKKNLMLLLLPIKPELLKKKLILTPLPKKLQKKPELSQRELLLKKYISNTMRRLLLKNKKRSGLLHGVSGEQRKSSPFLSSHKTRIALQNSVLNGQRQLTAKRRFPFLNQWNPQLKLK